MPQTDRLSQAVAILNEHEGIDTEPKQESKLEERLNTKVSEGNYNAPPEQPIGETKKEPEKIVEGVVISDAEAEAIRQREIKESRGNTVDIKKEGKLF